MYGFVISMLFPLQRVLVFPNVGLPQLTAAIV